MFDLSPAGIEAYNDEMGACGDARRCPRHPSVKTSSDDGMFDGVCGLCEGEMEKVMMRERVYTVLDCPVCGDLHPVHFDGYAGIDGDHVCDCPVAGRLELADVPDGELRDVVVVAPEEA